MTLLSRESGRVDLTSKFTTVFLLCLKMRAFEQVQFRYTKIKATVLHFEMVVCEFRTLGIGVTS